MAALQIRAESKSMPITPGGESAHIISVTTHLVQCVDSLVILNTNMYRNTTTLNLELATYHFYRSDLSVTDLNHL